MMQIFHFDHFSFDFSTLRKIINVIQSEKEVRVIIISAFRELENQFVQLVDAFTKESANSLKLLDNIKADIITYIAESEFSQPVLIDEINDLLVEAEWLLEDEIQDDYDYIYDQIVPLASIISAKLLAGFLGEQGLNFSFLDARDLIITDDKHRQATVDTDKTFLRINKLLQKENNWIIPGHIGATMDNQTSSFGEKKNLTSALIAKQLKLNEVDFFVDKSDSEGQVHIEDDGTLSVRINIRQL